MDGIGSTCRDQHCCYSILVRKEFLLNIFLHNHHIVPVLKGKGDANNPG